MSGVRYDGPSFDFAPFSAQPWRKDAACKSLPTSDFFPFPTEKDKAVNAKRICAECPVREACLADGLAEPDGIRGGLDAAERRRLAKKLRWSSDYRKASA